MNVDAQFNRFEEFNRQVELAAKEANFLLQGDFNIDLLSWRKENYYLKKAAEECQSFIGRQGLLRVN